MTDDREPLGDYLDIVITENYVERVRGVGYVSKSPLHSAIIEYIEDDVTGRPHPIDDAADHYLLRKFDEARRDWDGTLVNSQGKNGSVKRYGGSYAGTFFVNECCGEIAWRSLHNNPGWPCVECGHSPNGHHSAGVGGWEWCDVEGCNCGNNIGR